MIDGRYLDQYLNWEEEEVESGYQQVWIWGTWTSTYHNLFIQVQCMDFCTSGVVLSSNKDYIICNFLWYTIESIIVLCAINFSLAIFVNNSITCEYRDTSGGILEYRKCDSLIRPPWEPLFDFHTRPSRCFPKRNKEESSLLKVHESQQCVVYDIPVLSALIFHILSA